MADPPPAVAPPINWLSYMRPEFLLGLTVLIISVLLSSPLVLSGSPTMNWLHVIQAVLTGLGIKAASVSFNTALNTPVPDPVPVAVVVPPAVPPAMPPIISPITP
jgi:hypothetical protein